jgi:hypothetical protein
MRYWIAVAKQSAAFGVTLFAVVATLTTLPVM